MSIKNSKQLVLQHARLAPLPQNVKLVKQDMDFIKPNALLVQLELIYLDKIA